MVASIAGELPEGTISSARPFRAPHHSASMASLVGGGLRPRPGEVSLAHNGVLFLDELPEFQPSVLDALRQPLENGEVAVTRVNYRVTYPARFQLIAAMNPCRCGRFGEPGFACKRGKSCDIDYQSRISGPFLDRMDIMLEVPAVSAVDLMSRQASESSADVALRVLHAQQMQIARYKGLTNVRLNAHAPHDDIQQACAMDKAARAMMQEAATRMRLSARGLTRALRTARTIADLEGSADVQRVHLGEALSYRMMIDRSPS